MLGEFEYQSCDNDLQRLIINNSVLLCVKPII